MNKTTESLKLAEKMAIRHGVRMCDENGDTHGEELYCIGIDDIADIIREVLAEPEITTPDVCGEVCARAKLCYGCGKALDEANAKLADHSGDGNEMVAEPVKQEPVATVKRNEDDSLVFTPLYDFYVVNGMELYAAPVDAKAIRAEALEEAAKVCDLEGNTDANMNKTWRNGCFDCAAAIRNLK